MNCPICKNEMREVEENEYYCQTISCELLGHTPRQKWEMDSLAKIIAAAQQASFEQARVMAAQRVDLAISEGDSLADVAVDIRALRRPDDAPAPICPDCKEPMQRGSVWLCVRDGRTV